MCITSGDWIVYLPYIAKITPPCAMWCNAMMMGWHSSWEPSQLTQWKQQQFRKVTHMQAHTYMSVLEETSDLKEVALSWCRQVFSLEWAALHTELHLIWWLQSFLSIRRISLKTLFTQFKRGSETFRNKLADHYQNFFLFPESEWSPLSFLCSQYTWNNLWHHSNHWGQWAGSTSPNHTFLPHGVAPRPITNSTSPGRWCTLNVQ